MNYKESVIDALIDEYLIDEVEAYNIIDRNPDVLEVCEVDEISPKDCAHLILSDEFRDTYDIDEAAKKKKNAKKIDKVMGEFKRGTLKSGSGKKVTNRDQALAIAYSEAGMANEHYHNNFRAKWTKD